MKQEKKPLARIEVIVDKDPDSKNPAGRDCSVEVEGRGSEVLFALANAINEVSDSIGISPERLLPLLAAGCKAEKASRKQKTDLSPLLHMMREGGEQ